MATYIDTVDITITFSSSSTITEIEATVNKAKNIKNALLQSATLQKRNNLIYMSHLLKFKYNEHI